MYSLGYYPAVIATPRMVPMKLVAPVVPVAPVVIPTVRAAPAFYQMPPSPYMVSPRGPPVPSNFQVEGILRNGEFRTLHLRDRDDDFGFIPDHLRYDLMKNYGRYPRTDVRISSTHGRYEIDAMPRYYDDNDYNRDYYPSELRMIGFNEVRGEPREYTIRRPRERF
ncbi:hypothetical protein ACOMHN_049822 [Nucella lapillus]